MYKKRWVNKYRTNYYTDCRAHYRIRAIRGKMSQRFVFCSVIINSRCSNVESRSAGSATSLIQFAWPCGACKYYSAQIFFLRDVSFYVFRYLIFLHSSSYRDTVYRKCIQPLITFSMVSFTYVTNNNCVVPYPVFPYISLFSKCIGK